MYFTGLISSLNQTLIGGIGFTIRPRMMDQFMVLLPDKVFRLVTKHPGSGRVNKNCLALGIQTINAFPGRFQYKFVTPHHFMSYLFHPLSYGNIPGKDGNTGDLLSGVKDRIYCSVQNPSLTFLLKSYRFFCAGNLVYLCFK